MSYPGGNPPQGAQPGQWPGPGQPAQPHGGSAPHQQVPPTYGQSGPHQQVPQQPYSGSGSNPQVPQPYGQPGASQAGHPYGQSGANQQVPQPPYGQAAPQQPYGAASRQPMPQPYGPQSYGQQPPYGAQPQYGQVPQHVPPAPPGITVDASYEWFSFMLGLLTKPKIRVNGHQVPITRWGENHIPVGPGTHHVWVATPWLFDMGAAQLPVQVTPGPGARVYYKPPAVVFLNGAIGLGPQKTPGVLFVFLPFVIIAVFVLLILILALVAGA